MDHQKFYLLYIDTIRKYFIVKKAPYNLNGEQTEQFNKVIQAHILEYL